MSEGRDFIKEAVKDARSLMDAAVERAKNELVEDLAPAIKQLLEQRSKGAVSEASPAGHVNGVRKLNGKVRSAEQRAENADPNSPDQVEEGSDPTLALEDALKEFFPKENEKMADEKKSSKKASEKVEAAGQDGNVVEETFEISDAELKRVYEASLQTEVQVKKGFSDIAKPQEIDQASKEKGIHPVKGGESPWNENTPPAKKDWIPEQVQQMLQAGLSENKALRENLRKAVAMIETLGKKLHEVNLFNNKVMHVNKILGKNRLTQEQKTFVLESMDKARSISEVKTIYETIVGGLKSATSALQEGRVARPPKADAQRARTSGTPDQKVLSESVDRSNDAGKYSRLEKLAGIVGGK